MKRTLKRLPIYPQDSLYLGKGIYVSGRGLKKTIVSMYPNLVRRYALRKSFNSESGEIVYTYVWHSIMMELRESGKDKEIINKLIEDGHSQEEE